MPNDWVPVALLEVPVPIQVRATEYWDALRREFDLIRTAAPGADTVPARLSELIDDLEAKFGALGAAASEQLQAAIDDGAAAVDLEYVVPEEAAPAAASLNEGLDRADDYCRAGQHLLTLAAPTEVAAYRRWFLGQFVDQVHGAEPVAWPTFERATSECEGTSGADGPGRAPDDLERRTTAVPLPPGWTLEDGAPPVLRVETEIDLESAPSLRGLLSQLAAAGDDRVRLDLSAVAFVDSVGLSVLAAAHARFRDEGGVLELLVSRPVARVLELTGMDEVLDLTAATDS